MTTKIYEIIYERNLTELCFFVHHLYFFRGSKRRDREREREVMAKEARIADVFIYASDILKRDKLCLCN